MNNIESKEFAKRARAFCRDQYVFAGRGRTDRTGRAHSTIPVEVVDGDCQPRLTGLPYWKTTVRNGPNFSRTLYTPSTLRVVVGRDWNPYDNDNH